MFLWRISRHLDLTGTAGLWLPGRWHRVGRPIVYLATNPAAALLEACVHTSANNIPPNYLLLKVSVPEELTTSRVDVASLPEDWKIRPEVTQDAGTAWLKSNASPLLGVPSAVVPETLNFLLNPQRPDAGRCMIVNTRSYPFDPRIKF